MDRRAFLGTTLSCAAFIKAALPRIKLSLSGRISEPIGDVPNLKPLMFVEFLRVAKSAGYDAVCIRPLQCNIATPLDQMMDMAARIRTAGLAVSMVTCDNDQPPNNDCAPFALLNMGPRIAMAEMFGAKLIRCQIKRREQLGWAQRACDEARERGLWITHLAHPDSLFGNVEDAIECLKKINRPNFGLTYEHGKLDVHTQRLRFGRDKKHRAMDRKRVRAEPEVSASRKAGKRAPCPRFR
jgi:hypothetical protein